MKELAKAYDPKNVEDRIYKAWEESGYFSPKIDSNKKPYTIILPPPNANANLHAGHMMYVIQDFLIRWKRMAGYSALWLPGADHAGFETQVVYERKLKEEGKSRFDFTREELYSNVMDFVLNNKSNMISQLKKAGFSLDWSREKFTLDPDIIKRVYKTFKKLSDDGLLYRESRLVNYCTTHGTGFSDLEVEHEEQEGFIYYIKCKIKDSDQFLIVATTRPETIPGDTGIAVNPKDERYKELVGKIVLNPFNGREMPIVADDFVDLEFGTGAVKLTPAHDENDFEAGKRHGMPLIQVIGFDGKMTKEAGELEGLNVRKAREKILEILTERGLVEKTEKHLNSIGKCYKCGTIIEPLPLSQWYIKMKDLANKAIEVVRNGEVKIFPENYEKVYYNWLENIHDWNISRQIVWGIRIPAWHCNDCDEWTITEGEVPEKCKCGSVNLEQDQDGFDTWFSSGQWPFVTLGYPESEDFKYFYPTSVMETGYDILFFWVARMIMLGIYTTGKIPFETVYLHGMVRDSQGRKMSKSKGNVVNPMDLIEQYGADTMRFSLLYQVTGTQDLRVAEDTLKMSKTFMNKIWNATRFVQMKLGDYEQKGELKFTENTEADKEIKAKLEEIKKSYNENIEKYRFGQAAEEIYHFFWHQFCDVYIEKAKDQIPYPLPENPDEKLIRETKDNLLYILKNSLILLHPIIPFITEEIYQILPIENKKEFLMIEDWVE